MLVCCSFLSCLLGSLAPCQSSLYHLLFDASGFIVAAVEHADGSATLSAKLQGGVWAVVPKDPLTPREENDLDAQHVKRNAQLHVRVRGASCADGFVVVVL